MCAPVEVLLVMLYPERILTQQEIPETVHHSTGCLQISPGPGFPESRNARICLHLDAKVSVCILILPGRTKSVRLSAEMAITSKYLC